MDTPELVQPHGSEPFREQFRQVSAQLQARLATIRSRFTHPGDKGVSAESALREVLREYLPRRFAIGNGEVIDSEGHRSRQCDLVIADEDHPFTFTEQSPGLFFVECVTAAGEVKSVLTGAELDSTVDKGRRFKQLAVSQPVGSLYHTNPSDLARFHRCPPFFLFAFESQLSVETIHERLVAAGQTGGAGVDAVFVLDRGTLIDLGDGQGAFVASAVDGSGQRLQGWIRASADEPLFGLLAWLSVVMPRVVRFQSVLPQYLLPRPRS